MENEKSYFPIELESYKDLLHHDFPKTWGGYVGTIRVYDDDDGRRIQVRLSPIGDHSNYIGWTNDKTMIKVLVEAHVRGQRISGYTNSNYKIQWLDYSLNRRLSPTSPDFNHSLEI